VNGVQVSTSSINLLTFAGNEKMAAAGRAAGKAWGLLPVVYAEKFAEFIPNDEERKVFSETVSQQFQSGDYHLSFRVYETLSTVVLTIGTW
jgi:hypothetical protein